MGTGYEDDDENDQILADVSSRPVGIRVPARVRAQMESSRKAAVAAVSPGGHEVKGIELARPGEPQTIILP